MILNLSSVLNVMQTQYIHVLVATIFVSSFISMGMLFKWMKRTRITIEKTTLHAFRLFCGRNYCGMVVCDNANVDAC